MSAPSAEHSLIYWVVGVITTLFGFVAGKLWFDQNELHKNMATKQDVADLHQHIREDMKLEFACLHAALGLRYEAKERAKEEDASQEG